jgi:two-component response regulator ARR-A family
MMQHIHQGETKIARYFPLGLSSVMVMAAADSQFHVLVVDDSLIDRKLIERLLKTSSYQGKAEKRVMGFLLLLEVFIALSDGNFDMKILHLLLAVTTVDSSSKALEFLGLHEDDPTNPNQPSISPNTHQVNHFFWDCQLY